MFLENESAVRSEVDADEDGVVERWEYYDESGQLEKIGSFSMDDGQVDTWLFPDGKGGISRIERSMARDGLVSRWEYYKGEQLVRTEEDTDGDGEVDQWERHTGGVMVEISLDTTFSRRQPDRRLTYSPDGTLLSIEVDPDGDGEFLPGPPVDGPER